MEENRYIRGLNYAKKKLHARIRNITRNQGNDSGRKKSEYFGFKDNYVVKELLKREHRKQRKQAAGIMPQPKGWTKVSRD